MRELQKSDRESPVDPPPTFDPKREAADVDLDAMDPVAAGRRRVPPARQWFVYLLRCANGCLYTGIATDVQKRLAVHNAGKGSAYVRAHRPARLVACTPADGRSAASVLECFVKSLKRSQKLALAKEWKAAAKKLRAAGSVGQELR